MMGVSCVTVSQSRAYGIPATCGRPFVIDGEARLAAIVNGERGWASSPAPDVTALDESTRAELTQHWAQLGAMEHASVAAFARFTLELLSLGAPAELAASAQQALGDEIRHAKLCFGLASAYAGRALGPGPLSSEGALGQASFEAIVENAFAEACVGETLAAVEAAEAAAHATDPVVRRVLLGIAEDERRHAEFGWRFVSWALAQSSAGERARLERRLAEAVSRARMQALAVSRPHRSASTLLAHGMLTGALRNEGRRAALDELVLPLARGLVARAA